MPGNQTFGVNYSTKDYTLLRQDSRLILDWILGNPVAPETDDGSWAFYYNFHQFLYTEPQDETQGLGVFGRYGVADDKTNIVDSFYSVGVGGKGLFDERDNDTFGIGYFYTKTSSEFTDTVGSIPIIGPALASNINDGEGFEIFYNFEVNPWCNITPDFQIIEPANTTVDTAYVVGVRAKIVF
jgi:porin